MLLITVFETAADSGCYITKIIYDLRPLDETGDFNELIVDL